MNVYGTSQQVAAHDHEENVKQVNQSSFMATI